MTESRHTIFQAISALLRLPSAVATGCRSIPVFALGLCLESLALAAAPAFINTAYAQQIDWEKVDGAIGRKAAASGDVHRYGFPRGDLNVMLDGVALKPALALGGWVAFKPHGR